MLFSFAEETGRMKGSLNMMPAEMRIEAMINVMVAEAIKTSEIEGEYFSREDVVSSIKTNLGLSKIQDKIKNKKAHGIGALMVEVRKSFADPLTEEKICSWHEMAMADSENIAIGKWRTHAEPMQVISGPMGKQKNHFEAPPSAQIPLEMRKFYRWFNDTAPGGKTEIKKAPVRSAMAHLYFESIHPFEDGNGRIGRAIAEKALLQSTGGSILLSLSRTIEADKKSYYSALEKAQKQNEITPWMKYFVSVILKAQQQAREPIDFTLNKTNFFDRFKDMLNERQIKVIKKMMEAGPEGFAGGMNADKYSSISKISKATATRDLQYLAEIKAFSIHGGGRSTRYAINFNADKIL